MNEIIINKKYFENNISQLISKLNFVFTSKQKLLANYNIKIDISDDDFTAISAIIIYKFISFSIDNKCLLNPMASVRLLELFSKFHLNELIEAYSKKRDVEKWYSKIKPVVKDEFFIAPHPISRTELKNYQDLEEKYYDTIKEYYKDFDEGVIDCIKTCIVEIASNFYYHATDNKSILMSEGTRNKVEIISVDTSKGIISTMREKYNDKSDIEILKKSFQRSFSSKIDKGHCGTGLWLVNEIVTELKGTLILHTEGYRYRNIQGNITTFASTYWKGTILYVKLPISNNINETLKLILSKGKKYIN
jgi:hypothetical protein